MKTKEGVDKIQLHKYNKLCIVLNLIEKTSTHSKIPNFKLFAEKLVQVRPKFSKTELQTLPNSGT